MSVEEKPQDINIGRFIVSVLNGNIFSREHFLSSLPFLSYLSLLVLLYIGMGYYAEGTIRKMDKVNKELKEYRSEYISLKSRLNQMSLQSEVAKRVEYMGLKESITPPLKIVLTQNEIEKFREENE